MLFILLFFFECTMRPACLKPIHFMDCKSSRTWYLFQRRRINECQTKIDDIRMKIRYGLGCVSSLYILRLCVYIYDWNLYHNPIKLACACFCNNENFTACFPINIFHLRLDLCSIAMVHKHWHIAVQQNIWCGAFSSPNHERLGTCAHTACVVWSSVLPPFYTTITIYHRPSIVLYTSNSFWFYITA